MPYYRFLKPSYGEKIRDLCYCCQFRQSRPSNPEEVDRPSRFKPATRSGTIRPEVGRKDASFSINLKLFDSSQIGFLFLHRLTFQIDSTFKGTSGGYWSVICHVSAFFLLFSIKTQAIPKGRYPPIQYRNRFCWNDI
jgi:hypothetical protein